MTPEDARRDFVREAVHVRDVFERAHGKLYAAIMEADESGDLLPALRDLESAYCTYRLHATREQIERG